MARRVTGPVVAFFLLLGAACSRGSATPSTGSATNPAGSTTTGASSTSATSSPTGDSGNVTGQIVFAGDVGAQLDPSTPSSSLPSHIYRVGSNGSPAQPLTNGTQDGSPVWSPDGTQIAYITQQAEQPAGEGVFVMHADGSGARQAFHGLVTAISWSPNGTQIALTGMPYPPPDKVSGDHIYLVDLSGSQPRDLSQNDSDDSWPAWSPDGKQIAFMRPLANSFYDAIFLMNADGSNQHQVTGPDIQVVNVDPSWLPWSPDGRTLLFQELSYGAGTPDPNVAPSTLSLDVIDSDGTNLRHISKKGDTDIFSRWSPDGQRILFTRASLTRASDVIPTVCVMQADGSNLHCLTNGKLPASSGAWSPDGSQIAYFGLHQQIAGLGTPQAQPNAGDLLIMNADGSNAHVVVANVFDSTELAAGPAWRPGSN